MSTYYFVADLPYGTILARDIPVFGFRTGDKVTTPPWPSAEAATDMGLKVLATRINPQVPVHFAMPVVTARNFFPFGRRFDKIILYAYKQNSIDGYMTGTSVAVVFRNVQVKSHSPSYDFPLPPGVMKRHFETEKGMGRDFLIGHSVKLFVQTAEVV